jgi:hypothetical protein
MSTPHGTVSQKPIILAATIYEVHPLNSHNRRAFRQQGGEAADVRRPLRG